VAKEILHRNDVNSYYANNSGKHSVGVVGEMAIFHQLPLILS